MITRNFRVRAREVKRIMKETSHTKHTVTGTGARFTNLRKVVFTVSLFYDIE